jgi:dolichol kinase
MVNELYRQSIHLITGIVAAVAAFLLPKSVFVVITGLIALVAVAIAIFFQKDLKRFLGMLEREHIAFKGKGLVFFALGVFFTAVLFWEHAGAALLLLAIPDAAATVVGSLFRSPELPYNHRKTYLGSGIFFVCALVIFSFIHFSAGILLAAFLLTALESFDYREIPFLDDNLVIPVVAAYLLTLPW